jgi:hypothetical protein
MRNEAGSAGTKFVAEVKAARPEQAGRQERHLIVRVGNCAHFGW